MVSLELVLDFLADSGIRATYMAVGEATGIFYRHLRSEPQFIGADPARPGSSLPRPANRLRRSTDRDLGTRS